MGGMSLWHWIVVGVVVMLLFGRGKISEIMGDAAKGIKAFKKGMTDDPDEKKDVPPVTGTVINPTVPPPAATTPAPAPAKPAEAKPAVERQSA